MDLFRGLNPQQAEAVRHTEGPLLILAGAGSGKTRVLTHRIAYMVMEKKVSPHSILAITFTNKAAREMKERVENILGRSTNGLWISTFHSMCARILRQEIHTLGYTRTFTIYDQDDQKTLVRDCFRELNLNDKDRQFDPGVVVDRINRAKDACVWPDTYEGHFREDFRSGRVAPVYRLYQQKLKKSNALDFGDLIALTVRLFQEDSKVLKSYQDQFRYILVDEYQDTNHAQYRLVEMLARRSGNLCVVGDDDQSIYSFRGADISNILDFEKDFKGCTVIKLEQNYRSTVNIIKAAGQVIANNMGRKSKTLWTANPEGSRISIIKAENAYDEARQITSRIRHECASGTHSFGDYAILYRINALSRVLEESLLAEGIPYTIYGGIRFYDRKEIKDVLAYIRFLVNPGDVLSLRRIINVPARGIGAVTLSRIEQTAAQLGISILEAVEHLKSDPASKRAFIALDGFHRLISQLMAQKDRVPVHTMIERVLEETGLVKELEQQDHDTEHDRAGNVRELVSLARDFEDQASTGLEEFLEHVALVSDTDRMGPDSENVTLMTLHSAKGLEFPVVFLAGMEDGIFPSQRSIGSSYQTEEERRLCYVGITRAKERLILTHARERMLYGSTQAQQPSRFLKEIPADCCDAPGRPPRKKDTVTSQDNRQTLKPGDRVRHKKFGPGVVTAMVPNRDDLYITVEFDDAGIRRFLGSLANLEKLG
ncbi:MAG TPA: ATP-dependent DNA helicase PcrA [Clostridiales bacterium]|nr:ATP-dependent DNA helicase PcrA [Clostridiales bacterium]